MRQIRHSIFETNSSSTHNMTIISDEDLQKLKSGPDLYFDCGKILTKAKALAKLNDHRLKPVGYSCD